MKKHTFDIFLSLYVAGFILTFGHASAYWHTCPTKQDAMGVALGSIVVAGFFPLYWSQIAFEGDKKCTL